MAFIYPFISSLFGDAFHLSLVILFLPLISFIFLFLLAHYLPRKGDLIATTLAGIAFILSVVLFTGAWGMEVLSVQIPWFRLATIDGAIVFSVSLHINDLSSMMLVLVTFISLLVHIYSLEYMKGKRHYERYYPYLSLFTFSMTGIVLSDNLLITFMCWELVGFSSYLLIGFWYEKEAAMKAAKKAFLFNRIGDTGFIIGIIALYTVAGSFELSDLQMLAEKGEISSPILFMASVGLFLGCVGKSAQFPLHVWLPDAMEGPTPASALIHAATMVAAGIFLLVKVHLLLHPDVLTIIAFTGAITAFLGAVPALFQNDIKKVLAYSTVSQLGYMIMAIGVQAFDASFFHLITHGFFKACLFLAAGSVIHAMHEIKHELFVKGHYRNFDSQDMRLMGGFRKQMPLTFYSYVIGSASLIGLPLFSGFLSKDAILEGAWGWASEAQGVYYLVPLLGWLTVFLTAAYMTRQLILVFGGANRLSSLYPQSKEIFTALHDPSFLMKGPLIILSILSLGIAFSLNPLDSTHGWFFKLEGHLMTGILSSVLAGAGITLAYLIMKRVKVTSDRPVETRRARITDLLMHNWYLDKAYYYLLVRPGFATAHFFALVDLKIIDGIIHLTAILHVVLSHVVAWIDRLLVDGMVNFIARIAARMGSSLKAIQGSRVQGYFIFTLFTAILLILWIIIA